MKQSTEIEQKFDKANQLLKTAGILSIIFGCIGTLFGIFLAIFMPATGSPSSNEYDSGLLAVMVFLFWIAPHVFLIISGTQLLQKPLPGRARGLTITTLVIGALWNVVLLIFGILALVQMSDYEKGFKKS